MRYKVYPSDSTKFYVLDTTNNTIALYVSNKNIAIRVAEDMNKADQKEINSAKKH